MDRPVAIDFAGMAPSRPADAAARSRAGVLEMGHPAVVAWQVRMAVDEQAAAGPDYAATAQARVQGGEVLVGEGRALDLLDALRLAFDDLETQLESHQDRVRARAGQWLATVRQRLSQRQRSFI